MGIKKAHINELGLIISAGAESKRRPSGLVEALNKKIRFFISQSLINVRQTHIASN
jgi:hypothetical protein